MAKSKKRFGPPIRLTPPTDDTRELAPDKYLNRELSWLEFNHRVLCEAADPRNPLLERANFLSIFSSNLDEFVMKRVGLLKRQVNVGVLWRKPDGMSPQQQLTAIRRKILAMLAQQADIYTKEVVPALAQQGIHLLRYEELTDAERKQAQEVFQTKLFPVLTPLAVDPGHPFPFISNLSTSLGVTLRHPERDEKLFARVKVPEVLPPFVRLGPQPTNGGPMRFVSLMDLICHNLHELFRGMTVLNVMPFRITRNADVEGDADEADDLLDMVEQELRQRKFEKVVRLEHAPSPDPWMLNFLMQELELAEDDIYELPALLDFTDLRMVASLQLPQLRYEPWTPAVPKALAEPEVDIFSVIRNGDLLLHHPYESFHASIEKFVRAAAEDPDVLAIKITLYRTGEDSPFIRTLIKAAEAGKQVVAIVELQARFDEEHNIYLAQALEKAGVHVVYGIVGLKTHSKTTLVVRREQDGVRCYAHFGTGNYHVGTAKLYTDLSLLTCRADLTADLVDLFHFLTGRSLQREYRRLLVAPATMMDRFVELIDRETANKLAGKPARIVAKMNSLEAYRICKALYRASQAGVQIDLLVRGFCCLKPGVPGLSENIRVRSIIGRFLEHSRIFHFAAGSDDPLAGEFYIGSADWMYRNLLARVEVVTPIDDTAAKARMWEVLQTQLNDHVKAWDMQPDGSYAKRKPAAGAENTGTHDVLMRLTRTTTTGPVADARARATAGNTVAPGDDLPLLKDH